jgi:hypothetical protein
MCIFGSKLSVLLELFVSSVTLLCSSLCRLRFKRTLTPFKKPNEEDFKKNKEDIEQVDHIYLFIYLYIL